MLEIVLVIGMMLGVGIFLGGLAAYADDKVYPRIALGIMLLGIFLMMVGLLTWDFTGHTQPPFAIVTE